MAGCWLRWRDWGLCILLLIVLAHNAHLLLISNSAFATPWLLDCGCLLLGRGNSRLILCGPMSTNKLHLGLDLTQDLIHAAHGVDGSVHSTVGSYVVKICTWSLLWGGARSSCWRGVLLHFTFSCRVRPRLVCVWWTSNATVLSLKVVQNVVMSRSYIVVWSCAVCFLVRALSRVSDALLSTCLRWSIRILWISSVCLILSGWALVSRSKASSSRSSKWVVEIDWWFVIIIIGMSWLKLSAIGIVLLE